MGNPKAFLTVPRQEAGYRPVHDRIMDFSEVEQTLNTSERKLQASRCMDCGVPFCHWACPLGNRPPEFQDAMYKGKWKEAYEILTGTNDFPEFTGRICPALCEKSCVLKLSMDAPVTIREDEAAIIEAAFREGYVQPRQYERNGKSVAVIGSGPAGLAAANQLNRRGYAVTVFEKLEYVGGLLRFGEKLLGGYITSLPIQVEEEVKTAVRILHGASPSDIPIVESRKEYVVDWNTMTQIGLSKESIPANYRIINIPFRDEYPFLWGALVASFVLFLILLFASLWWLYLREQMRKKQALIALADEKETLSLAIEGGMTYAWRLDKGCFVFEDAFWASQGLNPRQLSFKEFMSFIHPDHWEGVKFNWRNLKSAHKKIVQELCNFDGKGYSGGSFVILLNSFRVVNIKQQVCCSTYKI